MAIHIMATDIMVHPGTGTAGDMIPGGVPPGAGTGVGPGRPGVGAGAGVAPAGVHHGDHPGVADGMAVLTIHRQERSRPTAPDVLPETPTAT